ncbi:hypothetical protein CHS0354_022634 [Potamilus streckersoni]|uniref:VWFA domain-containing protein n=1 Tax=Potamilus streckersoni TaxID=2493646 RepID=A0AAE0TG35_9BIVA|nr:hypothetical protein CHS0354_022634 [Potamilus streckersoni]
MITFSNTSKVEFNLDTYNDQMSLQNAVLGVEYTGGFTNTWQALDTILDNIFIYRRPGIPFVAVVVTDGLSQEPKLTAKSAGFVHAKQIRTFAIGVGNQVDKDELVTIASRPESKYVFYVDDYALLTSIEDEIIRETCRDIRVFETSE